MKEQIADPHPLHAYIARLIADRLKERQVVVIYDKNEELRCFFGELTSEPATDALVTVRVGYRTPKLCIYDGSFLKVRFLVEPVTCDEIPEDTLIYIPGLERDEKGSLLMELEKAGDLYRPPALKQLARNVLRKRFTDVAHRRDAEVGRPAICRLRAHEPGRRGERWPVAAQEHLRRHRQLVDPDRMAG